MIRATALVAGLIFIGTGVISDGQAARQPSSGQSPSDLEIWLQAVEAHAPGRDDDAARRIGSWPHAKLFTLESELGPVAAALRRVRGTPAFDPKKLFKSVGPFAAVLGEALQRTAPDELLARAALLHSDVMVLRLAAPEAPRLSTGRPMMVLANDAQLGAGAMYSPNWDIARLMAGQMDMELSTSRRFVAAWHHAIAAYLASQMRLAELRTHLGLARHQLGDDAQVLLDQGALYEEFASPSVQLAKASARNSQIRIDVPDVAASLSDAVFCFRKALDVNPGLAEARLRLGRVLHMQDRNKEARAELLRAKSELGERADRYLVHLFLGIVEQELGELDAASGSFAEASRIYPGAQSAAIAHATVNILKGGSPDGSLGTRLATSSADRSRDDPWWSYNRGSGRYVDQRLADLWRKIPTRVTSAGR